VYIVQKYCPFNGKGGEYWLQPRNKNIEHKYFNKSVKEKHLRKTV
jgi:hypothetical protein